jgi:hypothetical protein
MTAREWIAAYAAAVALPPPGDDEFEAILALAGAAAHGSEPTAAPVACWIAARSGMSAAEALALARTVGAPPTAERRRSARPDRSSVTTASGNLDRAELSRLMRLELELGLEVAAADRRAAG